MIGPHRTVDSYRSVMYMMQKKHAKSHARDYGEFMASRLHVQLYISKVVHLLTLNFDRLTSKKWQIEMLDVISVKMI